MKKIDELINSLDNYDIIIIIFLAFMIMSLIIAIYLFLEEKKKNGFLNVKKRKGLLEKSYNVFTNFFLTKRYVEQMRKRYEMLCPEDDRSLMQKTMGMVFVIWGLSLAAAILLVGLNPSFYVAALTVLTIIAINHEYLEFCVNAMEMRLMEQLDKFLSDVRHSFYRHGMMDVAVADASELSGRIMKVNADKIQHVLDGSDKDGAIRIYNETVSNRFLRMFLSVAVYVSEFGDKVINEVSVLLMNINALKSDIYIEQMNRNETNFKFSGMIFIVLAPVYLLKGIKSWSIDITPDMADFYNGTAGVVLEIVIYASTVIMYVMINELKERNSVSIKDHDLIKKIAHMKFINRVLSNYEEKNRRKMERMEDILYRVGETMTAKQFFLRRLLYGAAMLLICIFITFSMHRENRLNLNTNPKFISNTEGLISDKYILQASEVVVRYMGEYKGRNVERQKIEDELRQEGIIRSEVLFDGVIDEIMLRIGNYSNEYFHWYELLFVVLTAGVFYWFPYLMLLYRRKVLKLDMGNEVAQFQSTIMMVMYLNNTTVLKVLELMESFALIFKESIKSCINDYSAGDLDALEKLKLRERYEPFRRLVDNLIISDKIGIQKAFDEVTEERKVSQEMLNQEYRITRDKKVAYGMLMAFIPAAITIAFYWIIPFAMNALTGLQEYDSIMKNLS